MSLSAVLNNAVSGLQVSQASLQLTASNVANVNTPGYARKVATQQTVVVGGNALGAEIAEIRRITDTFISREIRIAQSHTSHFDAMRLIHDRLQTVLGDPTSENSLSGRINKVFDNFASLPLDPASVPKRVSAIQELNSLGDQLNRIHTNVQDLRGIADQNLLEDVNTINESLNRISELNRLIKREVLAGREPGSLQDQRSQALETLAKVVDIRTYDLGDGEVAVTTLSGVTLLDANPRQLSYSSSGSVSAESTFTAITVHRVNPITGAIDPTGTPIEENIRAGSMRGWLDMRDTVLPDFAATVGELSQTLADRLNAIHNENTAYPPPSSMTGRQTGLAATDNHNFSGEATFYALDANQEITNQVTIDFGAIGPTINDVITAVNAGLGGDGTLAFSGGVMSLTAGGGATGIAIQQDATTPSSRGGRGFSHFFGMNDLVQANANSHFDTGFVGTNPHSFTGTVNLQFRGPNNDVALDTVVNFGALGASINDVITDLDTRFAGYADFSLNATTGELEITPTTAYSSYEVAVVSDSSNRASTGVSFSQMFGVSERFRINAARDFTVTADINAQPNRMALARVDATGSPAVTSANAEGALAFQNLGLDNVAFDDAGNLPGSTVNIANYAAQLLTNVSTLASNNRDMLEDRTALQNELAARRGEVEGVNVDEELANMMVYQTAYNAAARMVQAAQQMFEVLTNL